jgi:peptide/nickel transport system substrate-binding protein
VGPHYSRLLAFDPDRYPEVKGDLAESWEVAADRLTYTFRLKPGVTFHDGSPLTSADVKASYERIARPVEGVVSMRKARYEDLAAIEAPDPLTVVFRMRQPDSSMLLNFASPWNCIYSAAKLAADPRFPEKNILGSGPFRFVEHAKGSHWVGARFDGYHDKGKPHLDGFRAVFMAEPAMINAIQGGQIMAQFRGVSPAEAQRLRQAMGDRITIVESPWLCKLDLFFNNAKPPYDDIRVRRALTLAIDRWRGAEALARQTMVKDVGGVVRPGHPMAIAPKELERFAGFGRDGAAAKAEARRLLKEAGQENLKFRMVTRDVQSPFQPVAVYLIDQWRQVGVAVENGPVNVAQQKQAYLTGNYEVGLDANCFDVDEPDPQLLLYVSTDRSPVNLAHYTDRAMDALYETQKRATTAPEQLAAIRAFETRLHENSYAAPVVWWQRIVAHSSAIRGWKILPSHYLNQDLASVWLAP